MRVCFSLVGVGLLLTSSGFAGFFDSNDNNNPQPIQNRNQNVYYYYNDQQQGTVQIDRNRPWVPQGNPAGMQSGMQDMQQPEMQQPGMQYMQPEMQPGMQDMRQSQFQNDDASMENGSNSYNGGMGQTQMSNSTVPGRSDAELLHSINDALTGTMFSKSFKQVHAQINNGVVTITGFVESDAERKEVLDRIQKVGIRHIDDRLTVHNPEEDQKAAAAANDQEMQRAVNDAIKGNVFAKNFKNVNAQVFNGDVTLTGFVNTEDARRDLIERVRSINGVQNVNDRLVVRPSAANYSRRTNNLIAQGVPPPVTEADRTLNSKVRAALQGGFFSKGYENILSDVRGGVVTLRGTVSSESDRTTVIDRVQKLDGVERIDNQIQIAK